MFLHVAYGAGPVLVTCSARYMNMQQDIIRQSFHIGNFTWLKESVPLALWRGRDLGRWWFETCFEFPV